MLSNLIKINSLLNLFKNVDLVTLSFHKTFQDIKEKMSVFVEFMQKHFVTKVLLV